VKPEIDHSSHCVANEVIPVLDQQAESNVVRDLRAHLVLHRVYGLLRRGVQEIGGVHLAGAQELLMYGVHFHKGPSPKESVGKEVRLQFQTVGKRIIPRHEDASVLMRDVIVR
jgi:hypothetical protein